MYHPRNKPTRNSHPSSSLPSPNVTLNFNISLADGTNLGGLLQDFDHRVLQNIVNSAQSLHPMPPAVTRYDFENCEDTIHVSAQPLSPTPLAVSCNDSKGDEISVTSSSSMDTSSSSKMENMDPIVLENVLPPPGNVEWSRFFDSQEDDADADADFVPEPFENEEVTDAKQDPTPEVLHFISPILVNYVEGGDNACVIVNPSLPVDPLLQKMNEACLEFTTFERTLISARIPRLDGDFYPSNILDLNAFRRPKSFSRFAYGGKYTGTRHGDILTMLEDLLFKYLQKQAQFATSDCASPDFQVSSYDLYSSKEKLGDDFLRFFETKLIHLINGLNKKQLLHNDHKRSYCRMASSGMTTSSANQIRHNHRAAISGGCKPFTNSNSGLLTDEDQLGLTFAELQVMTSIINNVECNDKGFKNAFALPRSVNPTIKGSIQLQRVKHFKSLIGEEAWNGEASDFLIEITGILCSLHNHTVDEKKLTTVGSCFIAMRGFLSCAAAIRVADICRFHSDKPGEVELCQITSTAIFPIPIDAIEDSSYRQELEDMTNDPSKKHIQFMVALYGRKCVEDYARTVHLEKQSFDSSEVDILAKLIARFILDGKGSDIDHLARFESDVPWTTQVSRDKIDQGEEPNIEQRLNHLCHAAENSSIFKCMSLDRHLMSSPTCDALNDLFSQGAFKEPIDFLGVLVYASISNSNLIIPAVANFVNQEKFPMTMEDFIAAHKDSQVESGFIESEHKFRPASGCFFFCQYDSFSRHKIVFFLRPICELLIDECRIIRANYTGTLTEVAKREIYERVCRSVNLMMETIWEHEDLVLRFKNAHEHLNSKLEKPPVISNFTASLLCHYLAIFEFIPRGMLSYARIDSNKGSGKAIKSISNLLLPEVKTKKNLPTLNEKYDWVCNQLRLSLWRDFAFP